MRRDVWIFIFAVGLILFGWPIVGIFKHNLPAYFFAVWFVYIALIFIITIFPRKGDKRD